MLAVHVTLRVKPGRAEEFRRIAEDENKHRRIFALLGDVLDANDELRADVSADDLSARLDCASAPYAPTAHNRATGRTSTTPHRMDRSCCA